MIKWLIIIFIIFLVLLVLLFVLDYILFRPLKYSQKYRTVIHENYSDVNKCVWFSSRRSKLRGHIYGINNKKGLIIFAHGLGTSSDYYIPEILYFAEHGYKVFAFDYTGYWKNKGIFLGFSQAVIDLNNAIKYIDDYSMPITLIGHSLGAYAASSVLNITSSNIKNVILYSGFSSSKEILNEFTNKNLRLGGKVVYFSISLVQRLVFGKKFSLNAIDGLNKSDVSLYIIHGSHDAEVNKDGAAIYAKKDMIKNQNVKFKLIETPNFNTHMGVIRKENTRDEINEELLNEIVKFITSIPYDEKL
jgi:alpha-beta hydrolase superfamily lysophospholipase